MALLLIIFSSTYAQSPFNTGNEWCFEANDWDGTGNGTRDTILVKVLSDTTMSNGKTYYKLNSTFIFFDLIRADSVGIYYYDTLNTREWLFYKYNIGIGDYNGGPNNVYLSVGYMMNEADSNRYNKIYKFAESKKLLWGDSALILNYYYDTGNDDSFSIYISPKYGFIGGHASGLSNHDLTLLGCKISGVSYGKITRINNAEVYLSQFKLAQNYPNPFNPTTTIAYSLSEDQLVKLKVYNILGKEVTTLVNEIQSSGQHKIIFDASGLSSGIYFLKFFAGKNQDVKKMLLMK